MVSAEFPKGATRMADMVQRHKSAADDCHRKGDVSEPLPKAKPTVTPERTDAAILTFPMMRERRSVHYCLRRRRAMWGGRRSSS